MSETARTDEIDELVSSVRDFVSHKETHKLKSRDRLMLTAELRVAAEAEIRIEVEPVVSSAPRPRDNILTLEPNPPAKPDREGLEATIAELEAAVTAQTDDWEADGGESFAQPEAWAASAFEKPRDMPEPASLPDNEFEEEIDVAVAQDPQADPIDLAGLEASIAERVVTGLDDQELRALVVATVHDELSGELGERITRNVRKMVRREINRVLAARELGQD